MRHHAPGLLLLSSVLGFGLAGPGPTVGAADDMFSSPPGLRDESNYVTGKHGDPVTGAFRLDGLGGNPYFPPGDCAHCHTFHPPTGNPYSLFLPYDTPEEQRDLCFFCHSGDLPPPNPPTPHPPPGAHRPASSMPCVDCHNAHDPEHGGGGIGGDCTECHGTTGSHATHTLANAKGPLTLLECEDCHVGAEYPRFEGGSSLAETHVCDDCHSPDGDYDGLNNGVGGSIGAKDNWDAVYTAAGDSLLPGKERWCIGCHDAGTSVVDGTSAPDLSEFYSAGHGKVGAGVDCQGCHDVTEGVHIDGEARSYAFDSAQYGPSQSGVEYAECYRLRRVVGEVPLMIPANYNITFNYNAQTMKDAAFRLCFKCHDSGKILDDTPGDGIDSNFKASAPNPPRNYSYAWGSGADVNEHVAHLMNYVGPFADADWDVATTGPGGQSGRDTMTGCSSCHNVHGAVGLEGSTNDPMVRDGRLAGRSGGYGFSYVVEDVGGGGYPQVTSVGATRENSVGAILRYNTEINNVCGGGMCHGNPAPPAGSSYDATGSSWGTHLEWYRPWTCYTCDLLPEPGAVLETYRHGGVITSAPAHLAWSEAGAAGGSVASRTLEWSSDGGATWNTIAAVAGPSPYSWDLAGVPNQTTTRVRVTVVDDGDPGLTKTDESLADVEVAVPGNDQLGPRIVTEHVVLTPSPEIEPEILILVLRASDEGLGGSPIDAAEWSLGPADPGRGMPLQGNWGSATVAVSGTIPVSQLTTPCDTLWIRARDSEAGWGEPAAIPVVVYGDGTGPLPEGPLAPLFHVQQNAPNPFGSETSLRFDLPERLRVRLTVHDVRGRLVRTLVDRELPAGSHRSRWHGTDERGWPVASGVYLIRLQAGEHGETRKAVLLR